MAGRRPGLALALVATMYGTAEAWAQRADPLLEQAAEMATTARRSGETAEQAANAIVSALALEGHQVVLALKAGGYSAEQTVPATIGPLSMSISQGFVSMLESGFERVASIRGFLADGRDIEPVVRALRDGGSSSRQSMADLRAAGLGGADAIRYVSRVHAINAAAMAEDSHALGVPAAEVAAAMTETGTPLPVVVTVLRDAGYEIDEIAIALRELLVPTGSIAFHLLSAGFDLDAVVVALLEALDLPPDVVLVALATTVDVMDAMTSMLKAQIEVQRVVMSAGSNALVTEGQLAAFTFAHAQSLTQALSILRELGWSAGMAVQDAPPLDADAMLAALVAAGYTALAAAAAVKDQSGASPEAIAHGLRQAGLDAVQVATTMIALYSAAVDMALDKNVDLATTYIISPIVTAFGLTMRQSFETFHGVLPLTVVFAWLKSANVLAANAAAWARSAGEQAHTIAAALRDGYQAHGAAVAQTLLDAGFQTLPVVLALKAELDIELADYIALAAAVQFAIDELVTALMIAYSATQLDVLALLPGSGG